MHQFKYFQFNRYHFAGLIYSRYGLSEREAANLMYIVDDKGLITKNRSNLVEMEKFFFGLSTFAAEETNLEGIGLLETVKQVKPDILIGLSGCGGIFTGD